MKRFTHEEWVAILNDSWIGNDAVPRARLETKMREIHAKYNKPEDYGKMNWQGLRQLMRAARSALEHERE
jgi:hypothetical protein